MNCLVVTILFGVVFLVRGSYGEAKSEGRLAAKVEKLIAMSRSPIMRFKKKEYLEYIKAKPRFSH